MAIQSEALYKCLVADLVDHFGPSFPKDCEGPMWPDMSVSEAAGYSIYHSFLKKIETGRTRETDQKAEDKFLHCNELCKNWTLPINYDSKLETLFGEVRQAVYDFWYSEGFAIDVHPFTLLSKGSVGPGVSIGSNGNSFYAKLFSSPLSCKDQRMYDWYIRYIKRFPDWIDAEFLRSLHFGGPSVTSRNRLSFVPKNDEISRTICIEPTLNTVFQSGFGRVLESRLGERFGISLSSQQLKNRNLARLGSINDDLVTIDLSSASDSISLRMLEWLLPADFYNQLCMYRSDSVEIKGRGTVPLFMVSTMGNGYTFPLQTMIFACVVTAALKFRGIRYERGSLKTWAVNGDDIICPEIVSQDVISLLTALGFRCNSDKTFVKGPFRESCGHDYFLGRNVRGVYVKSLRTPGSRYSVLNLLAQFSTRTGLLFERTYRMLYNSVQKLFVPPFENMDSGIRVPSSVCEKIWSKPRQLFLYNCLVPKPRFISISDDRIRVPKSARRLLYNPSGLYYSFIQGSITNSRIGIREDSIRYVRKRRVTPYWDNNSPDLPDPEWQWWNTIVQLYLEKV